MINSGWIFDIEADNLYLQSKKVWYINLTAFDKSRTLRLYPFRQPKEEVQRLLKEWIHSFPDGAPVMGMNILGYDLWILWRHFDIIPRVGKNGSDYLDGKQVVFIDGYVLSMYLNPNSPKHSLEYLSGGEEEEEGKINYRKSLIEAGAMTGDEPKGYEFSFWHDLMQDYCDRDVLSSTNVIEELWEQAIGRYGDSWVHKSFLQNSKDYWLYSAQAYSGVKFNVEKARVLVEDVEARMKVIKDEVDPKLPPRALKTAEQAFYKQPSKPFKADGTLSSIMVKWLQKHNAALMGDTILAYGMEVPLEPNTILPVKLPMEIDDNAELKQYFLDSGWVPSEDYWNFQKGPDGKPLRVDGKLIKTTPKINHQGQLCPNLQKLDGEIPSKVVKYLSLRNRLGVVKGWLENWRISFDGRLSAEISGYAPTSRVKHRTVVNVPKADIKVLLGSEMRDLFTVEKGFWYCGTDAAALENRTLSHYCVPMETQALTRSGWKHYSELIVGEDILAYDPERNLKVWTPLESLHKFNDAETYSITNNNFKVRATANHRWFVQYRNTLRKSYELKIVETKDLNTCCNIIVNAPTLEFEALSATDLAGGKYSVNWTERLCKKSLQGVRDWLEGFLVADGHFQGENAYKVCLGNLKGNWRFSQNEGEHFDCALTAAYLAQQNSVTVATRNYVRGKHFAATVNKKSLVTMQNMRVEYFGIEDVWCPKTKYGSWVMKQGNQITITGNTYKYDGGKFARMQLEGDCHSFNAFAFFPHLHNKFDINNPENKENPEFKPWRNKAKTGAYLLAFGGGAPKLASSLGLSPSEGKAAYDNYWAMNEGLGELKKSVEKYFDGPGKKKYVPGIDGRIVSVRGKNVLLSCLGQGCGAIAMSYAACLMDTWLGDLFLDELGRPYYNYQGFIVRRISMVHDEYSWEVEDGAHEAIRHLSVRAIIRAGEILKLALPLNGEGKMSFEGSWRDVH